MFMSPREFSDSLCIRNPRCMVSKYGMHPRDPICMVSKYGMHPRDPICMVSKYIPGSTREHRGAPGSTQEHHGAPGSAVTYVCPSICIKALKEKSYMYGK